MSADRLALLAGVHVVEVSQGLRGAFAGHSLVRLGAQVTRWDTGSPRPDVPDVCDHGKSTLPFPQDDDAVRALLRHADALIDDTADSRLARLAADADGLVHVQVTGMGVTEDDPNPPPGVVDASAGIMWDLGRAGAAPLPVPAGAASTMAGIHAATALVWALLQRRRGVPAPSVVDIAESDVITAQTGTYHLFLRAYGGRWNPAQRPERGSLGSSLGLGALLDCVDGPVLVYVSVPSQLARLHAMMPPDFAARFPTYRDGLVDREGFIAALREWAAPQTRRAALDTAEKYGVVCSPFLDMTELDVGGTLPLLRTERHEPARLPSPWLIGDASSGGSHVSGA